MENLCGIRGKGILMLPDLLRERHKFFCDQSANFGR